MRACQICDSNGKRVILNDYEGTNFCLYECTHCGHHYVDASFLSQEWFDNFYLTQYTTDDKLYSGARLKNLAVFIATYGVKTVLDIGGMDGELQAALHILDIKCNVVGVGGEVKKKYDAVILSHTLEHIYDIGAMFERIRSAMKKKSRLIAEIPIHLYDNYAEPRVYDFHFQHINKFRPRDIEALFIKHAFKIELSEQIEDYREYNCWRIVGVHG